MKLAPAAKIPAKLLNHSVTSIMRCQKTASRNELQQDTVPPWKAALSGCDFMSQMLAFLWRIRFQPAMLKWL